MFKQSYTYIFSFLIFNNFLLLDFSSENSVYYLILRKFMHLIDSK